MTVLDLGPVTSYGPLDGHFFFFFFPEKWVIPKGFMEPLHRRVVTSKLTILLLRMRGVAQAFGICHCVECFMVVAVFVRKL